MLCYEVNVRCAGTSLTNDYFHTIGEAKGHIKKYNPFIQGMNDDIVAEIKAHGLSFGVWNKSGKCIFETSKDYQ